MIVLLAVAAFFFPPAVAVAAREHAPLDIVWIVTALAELIAFGFFPHLTMPCGTAVLALILGLFSVSPRRPRGRRRSPYRRREDRELRKFRRELKAFGRRDLQHAAEFDPMPGDRRVA